MALITAAGLATAGKVAGSLGSIASGIKSFFGKSGNNSAKAAAQQYQYNLALQKQAQEWNEYMYKNRYTFQRQDLENAGINPLFGMGQAPSVTSGTNSVGMADYVGEQNNKFNQMMSLLDFGQNLSARRAQTKLTEQQVLTEEQNTLLRSAEVIGKELENKWLPKEKEASLKNQYADIMEKIAETNKKYAETRLTNAKTARENLEQAPMKRYEEMIRKNPELGRILEDLDRAGVSWKAYTNILKQGGTGLRLLLNK